MVAALVAGGLALADRRLRCPPVQAPTRTATPTLSPTAENIDDADIGLPVLQPLPDGLLEQTGPGWVLGIYEPTGSDS